MTENLNYIEMMIYNGTAWGNTIYVCMDNSPYAFQSINGSITLYTNTNGMVFQDLVYEHIYDGTNWTDYTIAGVAFGGSSTPCAVQDSSGNVFLFYENYTQYTDFILMQIKVPNSGWTEYTIVVNGSEHTAMLFPNNRISLVYVNGSELFEINGAINNQSASSATNTGNNQTANQTSNNTTTPRTLYVGGSGAGNYTKIQAAINASSPGDTVYVYNGTYYVDWRDGLNVSKSINLVGESNQNTTIRGGTESEFMHTNTCIVVAADYVNISNISIDNAWTGVYITGSSSTIVSCVITHCSNNGIDFGISSNNNTITYNAISDNNGPGIIVTGLNTTVAFNTITSCSRGVIVDARASNCTVAANMIIFCGCGVYFGDYYDYMHHYPSNNLVARNNITNCHEDGIYLKGSSNSIVLNTITYGFGHGIRIEDASNNRIGHNNIYGNWIDGLNVTTGDDNVAYNNWWGNATGPYNEMRNPSGTGDRVTGDILFSPWATAPFNITSAQLPTTQNRAPDAVIGVSAITVNVSDVVFVLVLASDPDGDNLTYTYNVTGGLVYGSGYMVNWTAPDIASIYVVSVIVSDGEFIATDAVNITVMNVTPPSVVNVPPVAYIVSIAPNPAPQNSTVTFTGTGSDSDGTVAEYLWASNVSGTIGAVASFTSGSLPAGAHNITLRVKDNNGTWSEPVSAVLIINTSTTIGGGNASTAGRPNDAGKSFVPGFGIAPLLVAVFVCAAATATRRRRRGC